MAGLTNGTDIEITTARCSQEEIHTHTALHHLLGRLPPAGMFGRDEFLFALGSLYLSIIP